MRSSGQRTIAGRRASSMNATRHGLSATSVIVIRGLEDEAEYEGLAADVIADLKPIGASKDCWPKEWRSFGGGFDECCVLKPNVYPSGIVNGQARAQLLRIQSEMEHGASGFALPLGTCSCPKPPNLRRRR